MPIDSNNLLSAASERKRGATDLLCNVAAMLKDQGRLAEAEPLYRLDLAAWRL